VSACRSFLLFTTLFWLFILLFSLANLTDFVFDVAIWFSSCAILTFFIATVLCSSSIIFFKVALR